MCRLARPFLGMRGLCADSQLAAGVLIGSPGDFGLPSFGGMPSAIWPALFLESFSRHAAKAALALKAPSVTTFDANVVAHARFLLTCGRFAAGFSALTDIGRNVG